MLLSISSSEQATRRAVIDRFTVVLLALVVIALASVEILTRIAFDRTSRVEQHEIAQRQALLASRAAAPGDPLVVVLGNSLMLDGVDAELLSRRMAPAYVTLPYFVLGTEYVDWYYALKRLFAEGMRPQYVVLGLSPNQLASSYTRGEYAAHYLFRAADLPAVSRETHLDLTGASSMVLAHFSQAYSTREATRGFVLGQLLPSVSDLLHNRLGFRKARDLDEATLFRLASERLPRLDRLCREHGARFILVVPPSYQYGTEVIQRAGRELNISVLTPVSNREFDSSDYGADGFHMSAKGAHTFTIRLSEALRDDFARR
jgi:hypothetical protein